MISYTWKCHIIAYSHVLYHLQIGEHKLVTAGADCTVVVWYFEKALELEEEIARLKESVKVSVFTRRGPLSSSKPIKKLQQQQHREEYYANIPIQMETNSTYENIFMDK